MIIQAENWADLIGLAFSFIVTISILSYAIGDNFLFRTTASIFIGITTGYGLIVSIYQVIIPQLIIPLISGDKQKILFLGIPLVLCGLLITKISSRFSNFGDPALALLIGVGVAVAIGGAVTGTIFPQVTASINLFEGIVISNSTSFRMIGGIVILTGTLATLIYFHYGAQNSHQHFIKRHVIIEWIAKLGNLFIIFTLGNVFAKVLITVLTIFSERFLFLYEFFYELF